jgi:beta-N-acetylhexosaminidase
MGRLFFYIKTAPAAAAILGMILSGCGGNSDIPEEVAPPEAVSTEVLIPPLSEIEILLNSMSLEQKIGQLLLIDLFYENGAPVLNLDETMKNYLREVSPGGVILYGANLDTPEQVRSLTKALQASSQTQLFIAIDHEGGIVNRFDDSGKIEATVLPSAAEVGQQESTEYAAEIGSLMGDELTSFGFNMNFAPVADVLFRKDSVIGSRAYGSDPEKVAEMVAAVVSAMQRAGVSSVLKHFPGHGAAAGDSHTGAVMLRKTVTELASHELVPFAAGIAAGADGIMAAHIIVGEHQEGALPATMSRAILTDLLQIELGFEGVIVTDSLTMKAAENAGNPALLAILAGADMLLRPADPREVITSLQAAVQEGTISINRIEKSVKKILTVKKRREMAVVSP